MSVHPLVAGLLNDAIEHHRSHRFDAARACCLRALALSPDDADALHLLGLAAHATGARAEAVAYLTRAAHLRPDVAHFQSNLGTSLMAAGKAGDAEACFRSALSRDSANEDAWVNLGLALLHLGREAEAEESLATALAIAPGRVDSMTHLAAARQRRADKAAAAGNVHDAEALYRSALAARGDHGPSLTNLGNLLAAQMRLPEAEALLRAATTVQPGSADAHHNLAAVLTASGQLEEAEAACLAALRIDPAHADAQYALGTARLLRGRMPEGFAGLEWRWKRRGFACPRSFAVPQWDGAPLAGRSLLLHAEQGLGDAIQMLRFVPAVAAGGHVLLEVPPPLRRLADRYTAAVDVFTNGDALPPFDLHCPLPSLPWALGLELAAIPAEPYLAPDPADVARWRTRLDPLSGLRVGLCWAGNPGYAADARRSIAPGLLSALGDLPGVSLVSLQTGSSPPAGLRLQDWTASLHDLSDTAALVTCLDLVVTVDTSVAHLAGALGRPVWLLNRYDTCWRWMLRREDSPWYPTLSIIRQQRPGGWDDVLAEVRSRLIASAQSDLR